MTAVVCTVQEPARSPSASFHTPGMNRFGANSAGHLPDRTSSSHSDSSSSARPSYSGCATHEGNSMIAKGPASLSDPSCPDLQSEVHQRRVTQPFADSYASMARNLSSEALAAGKQLMTCQHKHPNLTNLYNHACAGKSLVFAHPPWAHATYLCHVTQSMKPDMV